jgi:hypothetical protein
MLRATLPGGKDRPDLGSRNLQVLTVHERIQPFQRLCVLPLGAEHRKQAKADRENMLRNLLEEATTDTAAMVDKARREGLGMSMLLPCHDCGLQAFRIKLVGTANVPFCLACHAKRRLRCDSCGGHSDKHIPTEYCPGDQHFRCPECLAEYASKPLPKPRFLTPGMGG